MSTSVATSKCDQTFDFDDADIILRSSDGVEFYVHRCILRRISPVFADIFSLPQPQPGHSDDAGIIIDMAEDAASLRLLLGVCYPRTFCIEPKLDDIIDIKRVAVMTRKFDSDTLTWAVESALSRYAQRKPEVAYAIAWRYEL